MKIKTFLKYVVLIVPLLISQYALSANNKAIKTFEVFQAFQPNEDGTQGGLATTGVALNKKVVYLENSFLPNKYQKLYDGLIVKIHNPMVVDLYTYPAGKDGIEKTVAIIGEKSEIDNYISRLENKLKETKSKEESEKILKALNSLKSSSPF